MYLNELMNACISNIKASSDFSDYATTSSFTNLLSYIIDNPSELINYTYEENLSITLASIMTSSFPACNPEIKGIKVNYLVFACGFYLFMHQLETGRFYDRNWPAFITFLHTGRTEFAKFIVKTNPFAPERLSKLANCSVDSQRSVNAARGLELNMMVAAKDKGFLTSELLEWYNELKPENYELLEKDPFVNEAIPLYQVITNYLKANDVSFVNII